MVRSISLESKPWLMRKMVIALDCFITPLRLVISQLCSLMLLVSLKRVEVNTLLALHSVSITQILHDGLIQHDGPQEQGIRKGNASLEEFWISLIDQHKQDSGETKPVTVLVHMTSKLRDQN